jgi:hypothetical protein
MNELIDALKAAPELAKAVYSDAVAGTLRQVGKMGEDVAKTVRLALFPIQFTAAMQDRLAAYIDESMRKVPESRRAAPPQSMFLDVCERLRNCDPAELSAKLYVELLARSMDKERIGEAHPAFVQIVWQLAPDEVAVIQQLGAEFVDEDDKYDHIYARHPDDVTRTFSRASVTQLARDRLLDGASQDVDLFQRIERRCFVQERLAQPEFFATFLQHLVSLGLVEYSNNAWIGSRGWEKLRPDAVVHCIRLSPFGRLFYKACASS